MAASSPLSLYEQWLADRRRARSVGGYPLHYAVLSASLPEWPQLPTHAYLPLVQSFLSLIYTLGRAKRTWLDLCRERA